MVIEGLTLWLLSRILVSTNHALRKALLEGLRWVEARRDETDWVIVGWLVLSHHQFKLSGLSRLQASEHGGTGPVLMERGLKLGSSHLVDSSVVLELTKHVVVLHVVTGAYRKRRAL